MSFHIRLISLAVALVSALPAHALLVQEVSITPYKVVPISVTGFYTGNALAGINQLLVDGVAANGFCIDPFHFSLPSSTGYQYTPLVNAPKPPGTMGAIKADQISRLWTMAYSPTMTAAQAAAFQIAIWEIVGGTSFSISGSDYGASSLIASLATFNGPGASLIALSGPGQDYVIQDFRPRIAAVPETGATMFLLAIASVGLFSIERRLRAVRN
jgi:hypothetical protein